METLVDTKTDFMVIRVNISVQNCISYKRSTGLIALQIYINDTWYLQFNTLNLSIPCNEHIWLKDWVILSLCPRIKHDINDRWRAEWCLIETDVGGLNHTMRPSKRSLILCLVRGWSFKPHSDTSVTKNTEKYVWRAWREKRNKGNT